jgi:hypothetical protein
MIGTVFTVAVPVNVNSDDTGLVAYWKFDEDDGNTAYDSAGNNDGTLVNSPLWTSGQVKGALNFNGLNQYVDVGTSIVSEGLNELTLEAWVFFEGTLHPIANNMIISKHTWNYDSGRVFWMGIESNGRLEAKFWYDSSNGHVHLSDPDPFPIGQWIHIVAVWNKGDASLYRNGTLVNSASSVNPSTNGQDTEVTIGSVFGASDTYCFNGPIDEVAIWEKALTEDEINSHYTNGLNGKGYCYLPPDEAIQNIIDGVQEIIDNNPYSDLADKLEDVISSLETALEEILKDPPDNQAAIGNLEGAVGDIEAAVNDGLLDPDVGEYLMDQIAEIARQLAYEAIQIAIEQGGDPDEIQEAQDYLDEGDLLRESGQYKDAVAKYKDALAKAESAIS